MRSYEQLEQELENWIGYPIVSCSSGTAALHLALEALRLPLGSGVIVPNYTMIACARAVTLAGLRPIFVDCSEDLNLCLDSVDLACSKQDNVRAIMPVHIYGRRCDMEGLCNLAWKYDLLIVEDMAELHGIPPYPFSDVACWSFYRNKIVGGEEGGALCFPDTYFRGERSAVARSLKSIGFTDNHDFSHIPRGCNYRLADCLADLILDSIRRFDESILRRRRDEKSYDAFCPDNWRMPPRQSPWVYDLRVRDMDKQLQDRLVSVLKENGIEARHGFYPMKLQKEYEACPLYFVRGQPLSHVLYPEVFYLPLPAVEGQIEQAFNLIWRVFTPAIHPNAQLP